MEGLTIPKRMQWLALLLALTIGACGTQSPGSPASGRSTTPTATGSLDAAKEARAAAVLENWHSALRQQPGHRALAITSPITFATGSWPASMDPGAAKIAYLAGQVVAASDLDAATPPEGTVSWSDGVTERFATLSGMEALAEMRAEGDADCGCEPLVISAARATHMTVTTSVGPATVPAWEFVLDLPENTITRIAVPAASRTEVRPLDEFPGHRIEAATAGEYGRRVTVGVVGSPQPATEPCGEDYGAMVVEADDAIVVFVETIRAHRSESRTPCVAIGAFRQVTVRLSQPLRGRALLDAKDGQPIPLDPGSFEVPNGG